MPSSSIHNWIGLYRAGKLTLEGKSVTPEGEPRTKGSRKGVKRAAYKKPTKGNKRAAAAEATTPARTGKEGMASRSVQAMQVQITRLENELAYVKADRDVLVKALASLTK